MIQSSVGCSEVSSPVILLSRCNLALKLRAVSVSDCGWIAWAGVVKTNDNSALTVTECLF